MQVIGDIRVLEVAASVMGSVRLVHPAVVLGPDGALLVDTGFPGDGPRAALRAELALAGVALDQIRAVIITHQDWDHTGGLGELLREIGGKVELLAHEEEKPYLQGERPLIKIPGRGGPPPPERWHKIIGNFMASLAHIWVSRTVADGEELPYGGGAVVIPTPGHSPGHICLYVKGAKALIAGDAMVVEEGRLMGPRVAFTPDLAGARQSLAKLADYDIETVICYHGGVYRGEANRRIAELAEEK
jgi:glyoxylase-like metal-dependent hydrolase (beta-lactamase superfamily II)